MRRVTRSAVDGSKKKREIDARMEEMPNEPKMTAMTIRRKVISRMMREMNRLKPDHVNSGVSLIGDKYLCFIHPEVR
jgi:uncharacterized protein YaaN involved in tellurite resistance